LTSSKDAQNQVKGILKSPPTKVPQLKSFSRVLIFLTRTNIWRYVLPKPVSPIAYGSLPQKHSELLILLGNAPTNSIIEPALRGKLFEEIKNRKSDHE